MNSGRITCTNWNMRGWIIGGGYGTNHLGLSKKSTISVIRCRRFLECLGAAMSVRSSSKCSLDRSRIIIGGNAAA